MAKFHVRTQSVRYVSIFVHVCMHVCMDVCSYEHMYVCTYVGLYVCMYAGTYVRMYVVCSIYNKHIESKALMHGSLYGFPQEQPAVFREHFCCMQHVPVRSCGDM